MKSDINGCSTCPTGSEQFEKYRCRITKKTRVQYDYRADGGELFSCTGKDLADCRAKRDQYFSRQYQKAA